jgi:hypothetical protein
MSQSRSDKPEPVLEGVEMLFHGSACFGATLAPSFEWSGSELYELKYWIHM